MRKKGKKSRSVTLRKTPFFMNGKEGILKSLLLEEKGEPLAADEVQ